MKQKSAHDLQIVRATDNLKFSYRGPSLGQASRTNQRIKALGRHLVWGLPHRRAIKEETMAKNHDWVYNQACRLSHDIHVVSHPL